MIPLPHYTSRYSKSNQYKINEGRLYKYCVWHYNIKYTESIFKKMAISPPTTASDAVSLRDVLHILSTLFEHKFRPNFSLFVVVNKYLELKLLFLGYISRWLWLEKNNEIINYRFFYRVFHKKPQKRNR